MATPTIKSTLAEAFPERPDLVEDSPELKKRVYFRIFYYILGRLDTIHDFSSERTTETNDTCLSLGIKPKDRMLFILKGILRRSDPLLKMADIYAELNTRPGKTFEHKMFSTFTDLLIIDRILDKVDDILFSNLGAGYTKLDFISTIKEYLYNEVYQLTPGTTLQQEIIQNGDIYFKSSRQTLSSSIFEINIPAIVYTPEWQANLIGFIKATYPQCLVNRGDTASPLKIVEDASAFPKSLFTNAVQNLRQFVKLNAPQTHWDPAGFHNFPDKKLTSHLDLIAGTKWGAPSFSCSRDLNNPATIKAHFNSQKNYFELDATRKNNLELDIMPHVSPSKINITAGPSVNHLFMHMVLHANSNKLNEVTRGKADDIFREAKRMINCANRALKSSHGIKNITLPLKEIADKAAYIRELETSKMSGDHEDKNAALFNDAVLWCGDEPLFCACVLDKVPAVYVRRPGPSIILRFYVPPPASAEESQQIKIQNDVKKCIHMALEYNKIFRNSDYVYIPFIESIKTVMRNEITIDGHAFLGNILKYVILKSFLEKDLKKLRELKEANNLLKGPGKLPELLNAYTQGAYKTGDITNERLSALAKDLQGKLQSKVEGQITSADISLLDTKIHDQLVDIPRVFNKTTTGISKLDYSLFTESNRGSMLPLFMSGGKGWDMNTNGLFTYYNSYINPIKEISSLYMLIMSALYRNNPAKNLDNADRHNRIIIIKHLVRITTLLQTLGLTVGERQVIVDRIKNNDVSKEAILNTTVLELYGRFTAEYAKLIEPPAAGGGGEVGKQGGGKYTLKRRHMKHSSHSQSSRSQTRNFTQRKMATKDLPMKKPSSKSKSVLEELNDPAGLIQISDNNNHTGNPTTSADTKEEVKGELEKEESNLYSEAYKLIMKGVPQAPFNLTSREYANQIVYRMMIIDSINEILNEPAKDSQEGGGGPGSLNQSAAAAAAAAGGGGGGGGGDEPPIYLETEQFWYDFSNDYIIPFMGKFFIHEKYDVPTLITCGLIDGTFLPALMSLLERVSTIDSRYITGDSKYMVEGAISVLESLNKTISKVYTNDKECIYVSERFGTDGTSMGVDGLKRIWNAIDEFPKEDDGKIVVPPLFFKNMQDFFQFLNAIFKNKEISDEDKGKPLIDLDNKDAYKDTLFSNNEDAYIKFIHENRKLVQYSTKLFIFTYLNLYGDSDTYEDSEDVDIVYDQAADTDIEAAGGGGGGGGGKGGSRGRTFKLEKRHKKSGKRRCGSPRRLSLRKDL